MIARLVSGAQTGVDSAPLGIALELGIPPAAAGVRAAGRPRMEGSTIVTLWLESYQACRAPTRARQ